MLLKDVGNCRSSSYRLPIRCCLSAGSDREWFVGIGVNVVHGSAIKVVVGTSCAPTSLSVAESWLDREPDPSTVM